MYLRQLAFQWLNGRTPSLIGKTVRGVILILIFLNGLAVILESVPAYQRLWGREFAWFEQISSGLFAFEYLIRLWVCVEDERFRHPFWGRVRYVLTPLAIVDLMAFLPFYLCAQSEQTQVLRVLRLVRLLNLGRYFTALELFIFVVRREFSTLMASTLMLVILIVLAASGMYLVEGKVQPEAFGSIPQAIWWAAVTLTTVGYGDVVPHRLGESVWSLHYHCRLRHGGVTGVDSDLSVHL